MNKTQVSWKLTIEKEAFPEMRLFHKCIFAPGVGLKPKLSGLITALHRVQTHVFKSIPQDLLHSFLHDSLSLQNRIEQVSDFSTMMFLSQYANNRLFPRNTFFALQSNRPGDSIIFQRHFVRSTSISFLQHQPALLRGGRPMYFITSVSETIAENKSATSSGTIFPQLTIVFVFQFWKGCEIPAVS
jgi:hypothetical protein